MRIGPASVVKLTPLVALPAPHIDRKAVGELLKKEQLDEFLRAVRVWE